MKKSRIIIPALAVMALSMGAAVTSTVAWFTANRNASAASQQITLVNPEGGMEVKGNNGKGTTVTSADTYSSDPVVVTHANSFRDGSVNLQTGNVYTSNLDDTGKLTSGAEYQLLGAGTNYLVGEAYAAQNYTLTFKFGTSSTKKAQYGLFFNGVGSGIDNEEGENTQYNTNKGLRVGFVCGNNKLAYAPSTHRVLGTTDTFVNGTTNPLGTYASDSNVVDESLHVTTFEGTTPTSRNLLGLFDLSETAKPTELTVTVWVWFEGSDPSIDTNATTLTTNQKVNLNFNVVEYVYKAE